MVGVHSVEGMRKLVERVADNRELGGRSKQCRSLLQTIVMSVMDSAGDNRCVKAAIRRQILPSLSD